MSLHPQAGQVAPASHAINIAQLVSHYYTIKPDVRIAEQAVAFGTSGHRGSAFTSSFNENHVLAVCQAVAEYRQQQGIVGPLFLGKDTHGLSEAAFISAMEVLIANGVTVVYQAGFGFTPTPVISHAILTFNDCASADIAHSSSGVLTCKQMLLAAAAQNPAIDSVAAGLADGIVITPSHNPPDDGGIKYNPPHGGPADTDATQWIETRANQLILAKLVDVKRLSYAEALKKPLAIAYDFVMPYVTDLGNVIDMAAIAKAGIRIGVDPLGGSGIAYWPAIAQHYGLDITVVNDAVDARFAFMPLDKDGKVRMDCSSPYAMANLIKLKNDFAIGIGNDPDFDRHGIVTPEGGLLNPNHYLAVAIDYLLQNRPQWDAALKIGKTLVSSALIDRVVQGHQRSLYEVPVGFKWFVDGLHSGTVAFGGEESAGASFLRQDGRVWSTDKDGFILGLLAAEILAVTGADPYQHYRRLTATYGEPLYRRLDAPANLAQKKALKSLDVTQVTQQSLAGDAILSVMNQAPGNGAAIGGVKVVTANGWFAARPSGTENSYKIYLESFVGEQHLQQLETDAKLFVNQVFSHLS